MSICGLHGRATLDVGNPFAFCDRCGFETNLSDLQWQMQFAGNGLINLRILVCDRCLDVPSPYLQAIILPPDPEPILNIRPGFMQAQESQGETQLVDDAVPSIDTIIFAQNGQPILTEDGQYINIG